MSDDPPKDLFGRLLDAKLGEADLRRRKGRRTPVRRGYAAPPGTGPEGETCATCQHRTVKRMSRGYQKCALRRSTWTRGEGSDILLKSPACRLWERFARPRHE